MPRTLRGVLGVLGVLGISRVALVYALSGLHAVVPMQVFGCSGHDSNSLQNDPVVKQALDDAFTASKEGSADQHEEGGWIYDCSGPGGFELRIVAWPPGDYDSITLGPMLDDPNCQLVGSYHTHPGAALDHPSNDGYANEKASDTDWEVAEELGIPSFVKWGLEGVPEEQGVTAYGPLDASTPCPGEAEFDAAWSSGEPHLATFDGYDYGFQAAGEFVLVRGGDLEIQTRQEPTATGNVTMNTAVVARIDGAVIEVNATQVVDDGRASPRADFTSFTAPGGGTVRNDGGTIRYRWADGSGMSFVGNAVTVALADTRRGAVEGLLGNFDGDPANDIVGVGGADLLADDRLTFAELYESLAETWVVSDATSLFTYEAGTSTASYRDPTVPRFRVTAGGLDPDALADAEQRCIDAGVEDTRRVADCAFDVAATGNDQFATDAAAAEAEADRMAPTPASPLVAAVTGVRVDEVANLLAAGGDPDETDADGRTVLLLAVPTGRADLVDALLDAGADPNRAGDDGTTALHVAAFWGFDDIAQRLLDAGADRTVPDDLGRTPAEIASAQGHVELAEQLG